MNLNNAPTSLSANAEQHFETDSALKNSLFKTPGAKMKKAGPLQADPAFCLQ
jgi:hypothetical protein